MNRRRRNTKLQSTKKDSPASSYIQNKNHEYLGRHVQLAPINYINNEVPENYSAKMGSPKLQSTMSPKKGLPIPYTHELAEEHANTKSPIFQYRKSNVIINHFDLSQGSFLGGCESSISS